MSELISINEAAEQGITRLRKPIWANKMDHVKIDIVDNKAGPWLHLCCPANTEANGRDPVDILGLGYDYGIKEFEPYEGPVFGSDEYNSEREKYEKIFNASIK